METVKPITPEEVEKERIHNIPDFVIEAVNKLLKKKWDGNEAIIKQDEIIAEMKHCWTSMENGVHFKSKVFSNHWLDFETIYEENGWNVEYDKPAYCESYDAYFKFTKKKKKV